MKEKIILTPDDCTIKEGLYLVEGKPFGVEIEVPEEVAKDQAKICIQSLKSRFREMTEDATFLSFPQLLKSTVRKKNEWIWAKAKKGSPLEYGYQNLHEDFMGLLLCQLEKPREQRATLVVPKNITDRPDFPHWYKDRRAVKNNQEAIANAYQQLIENEQGVLINHHTAGLTLTSEAKSLHAGIPMPFGNRITPQKENKLWLHKGKNKNI